MTREITNNENGKVSNLGIRQPIVTICGHVDHGKTSLLDALRGSSIQETEAGGITQKISFSLYPLNRLKTACPLIDKMGIKLDIPGFLFIDTPGHAAFTNLRKRGGSLADLAVLVMDINEGIKPQTAEVLQILKMNKTPFIIALNKIDNISGWRNLSSDLRKNIESQSPATKQNFAEKYLTIIGALQAHGFDSDLYYNITDFTKKVALVPCSARTKEGVPELALMLCGLSQRYLQERLKLAEDAKGVILEIKKEQNASYMEAILYDGELSRKHEIALSSFDGEPIVSKIRILEEILPLSTKFHPIESVKASTGIRIQLADKADVLPGMPFVIYKNNREEIAKMFKKQIADIIQTDKQGIIARADSLGSLEALLSLLRQQNIPVIRAGIGSINKTDIINAKANLGTNEVDAIVVGFNVQVDEEADLLAKNYSGIKILKDNVVYKLIEDLAKFREEKAKEIAKRKLMEMTSIVKVRILHQYVFRNTNPAIFGVRIEAGRLNHRLNFIDKTEEKAGKIKNIQSENKSVDEATEGMEVAISMPGMNFERKLKDKEFLYSDISESQFRKLKKNKELLSPKEMTLLQEIAEIKRRAQPDWGM
ncbi:MAG TPA: translation initiation factor IF-2 [Candidatus Pacearchaeota archaeon]|nr:translation initiation factor IF-2 [Candidatus Pacearchaeota archaeon]